MSRRTFVAGAGALVGSAAVATRASDAAAQRSPAGTVAAGVDPKRAAREAWIYALPLIEMATTRARNLAADPRQNVIHHQRRLSTPADRWLTAPNNDTLYSNGWLDLTDGPVTLTIPPMKGRYFCVPILNMYTDNEVVLSPRTIGEDGGVFTIVGPGQTGSGPNVVRVSTPHAWLFLRVLVDGPADLAAAHAAQDGFVLRGPAGRDLPAFAARNAAAGDYFDSARRLLAADPPSGMDALMLRRTAALLGSKPVPGDDPAVAAGAAEARALILGLAKQPPALVQGWTYPAPNIGLFGQDYLLRAGVALAGLGALPPAEAMYLGAADEHDRLIIEGDGPYRVTVPGDIPLDSFWSLTLYERVDGQQFLTDNPIKRYSIGDRTPGIRRGADGSIEVWISRTDPGGERSANWLPAPRSGAYSLYLRCYLPRRTFINGNWRMPRMERVST